MSDEVVLSPQAEVTLVSFDPPLANAVESHLMRLASSPTSMSRPAVLPYPPGSQMSEFTLTHDGRLHRFVMLFRYGSDEQTLKGQPSRRGSKPSCTFRNRRRTATCRPRSRSATSTVCRPST